MQLKQNKKVCIFSLFLFVGLFSQVLLAETLITVKSPTGHCMSYIASFGTDGYSSGCGSFASSKVIIPTDQEKSFTMTITDAEGDRNFDCANQVKFTCSINLANPNQGVISGAIHAVPVGGGEFGRGCTTGVQVSAEILGDTALHCTKDGG